MKPADITDAASSVAKDDHPKATATPPALAPPDKSPPAPKAKSDKIRVSPAVLDAAGKDGDELLRSLRTTGEGLTQVEAEDRARKTGPECSRAGTTARLVPPPPDHPPQSSGDPAGGTFLDFLCHRRPPSRERHGRNGDSRRGVALHPGDQGQFTPRPNSKP